MNETLATESKAKPGPGPKGAGGRLFVLEVNAGLIHSMDTDGSDKKTIVAGCRLPDGIVVDVEAGHIYWSNMGSSVATNDGSIERADLDGKNRRIIVPEGVTFTPKQIHLEKEASKLYWCDREGMRVMRSNLDGSLVETLIEAGRGESDRRDQTRWCVGVTIDPERKQITYHFDDQTWTLNIGGWMYSKADKTGVETQTAGFVRGRVLVSVPRTSGAAVSAWSSIAFHPHRAA